MSPKATREGTIAASALPDDPPADRVAESLRFLRDREIWHVTSRNPVVRSCADAARNRRRLGYVGIPLCDELKSLMYAYRDPAGVRRYALLHCRGHQKVDLRKVEMLLGAPVSRVGREEIAAEFGLTYGTVTPLLLTGRDRLVQIVDRSLFAEFYPPHTIMTNLGDLTHAVEVRARDLFSAIPNAETANIVAEHQRRIPQVKLGILTGNSPESGMLLWEMINRRIRSDSEVRFRGDTGFPRTVVESVPDMGSSMDLTRRVDDLRPLVLTAIQRLCDAGATVIGVACNTTQFFAPEIEEACVRNGVRFVATAEVTAQHLHREGVTSFDFLGIAPVTDLRGWSGFGQALADFEVEVPDAGVSAAIEELAFAVKREMVSSSTINQLRDTVNSLTSATVVIALTELSILLAQQKNPPRSGKVYIDTLAVLADAMAQVYLDERIAVGGA